MSTTGTTHVNRSTATTTPDAGPGLRWVADTEPGIQRLPHGDSFRYIAPNGKPLHEPQVLQRIRSLAIPPAYRDVWICRLANGHLQATGRDARGRKQYRYHPDWQSQRGQTKFDSLRRFGQVLPGIRQRVQRQLAGGDTPTRTRVLATLVRLLDTTWLRVGNQEYARSNQSFGLTTLQRRHTRLHGDDGVRLSFVGKSGKRHDLSLVDRRVANVVRRCREIPGQELFQFLDDDGDSHRIDSSDVNGWLADATHNQVSAKDFRTWHGSVLALQLLLKYDLAAAENRRPAAMLNEIIAAVAKRLGNTPAVCRKAYIHPTVLQLAETLGDAEAFAALQAQRWVQAPPALRGLNLPERQLMALLAKRRSTSPGKAPLSKK